MHMQSKTMDKMIPKPKSIKLGICMFSKKSFSQQKESEY
jgi:hypothetical protein